jgi:para-nitrobenzyl esterase
MRLRSIWIFTAVISIVFAVQQRAEAQLRGLELGSDLSPAILFEPAFSPKIHDYSAIVDRTNVKSVSIHPIADSSKDTVTVNGSSIEAGSPHKVDLKPGENKFAIVVTTASGNRTQYSLTIIQKDLSGQYKIERVQKGIWRISDYFGFPPNQDMYLIEGAAKAVLIDAGMGKGDLAVVAQRLTRLPIELAVTHGHGDHIGQIGQFVDSVVYMSEKDKGMIPKTIDTSKFIWVKDGDTIDLGGGRKLEVIDVPGHTLGSVLFLYRVGKTLAVGDAIGSGMYVWKFLPGTPSLVAYRDTLKKLEARLAGFNSLTFLTGHHWQEKTPLVGKAGKKMVSDMIILCDKIISGEITGVPNNFGGGKMKILTAEYGLAGIWYDPDNIRPAK